MAGFQRIGQKEAMRIMAEAQDYVILDVRRRDEFAAGHIPGAICVPLDEIGFDDIEELPDYDQLILVYCRSGRRSVQAAAKLCELGYTNVVEFGGIITWPGDVEQ